MAAVFVALHTRPISSIFCYTSWFKHTTTCSLWSTRPCTTHISDPPLRVMSSTQWGRILASNVLFINTAHHWMPCREPCKPSAPHHSLLHHVIIDGTCQKIILVTEMDNETFTGYFSWQYHPVPDDTDLTLVLWGPNTLDMVPQYTQLSMRNAPGTALCSMEQAHCSSTATTQQVFVAELKYFAFMEHAQTNWMYLQ